MIKRVKSRFSKKTEDTMRRFCLWGCITEKHAEAILQILEEELVDNTSAIRNLKALAGPSAEQFSDSFRLTKMIEFINKINID